ncbi:uncharacterized protein LOC132750957 [Ruditapes philippinarum]|uniref:uncharacterized protein LOC132750957 n=1 Tax=Ruditapes philippinarum TaxID=129788 RepID=UPI00295BF1DA|nr:uncharacterized protein LOC132750957 [Ruditapes philippinarum]
MEFTVLIGTTVVILISLGNMNISSGTKDADEKLSCNPYSALIIWYTGSGEDNSFFQQRRLLVVLISDFPENTSVSIVTIGAKDDIRLQFRKQDRITNWRDKILHHVPGTASNHTLPYTEIQKAILYHKTNSSEAELVYLLVNGKTVIRDVGNNGIKELRKKKTFVVLCEIQTENRSHTWLKFASNENYFIALDSITGDVNKTKEIILARSCQDSKFVCDTDMYWSSDRKGCNACTYICSSTCKVQPEYCFYACPFFHKYKLANNINKDKDYTSEPLQEHAREASDNNSWLIITLVGIVCILVLATVALVYKKKEKLWSFKHYVWSFKERRKFTEDEVSELNEQQNN